jgi:hypothetical protein
MKSSFRTTPTLIVPGKSRNSASVPSIRFTLPALNVAARMYFLPPMTLYYVAPGEMSVCSTFGSKTLYRGMRKCDYDLHRQND